MAAGSTPSSGVIASRTGDAPFNVRRVYRVMKVHGLLLERQGLSRDWGDRGRSGMIARIVVGRGIVVWGGFCRGPPLRAGFQLVPVINEAV